MEKVQVEKETLVCLMRNFVALFEQSAMSEPANFGEPCADCPIAEQCGYDWEKRIVPASEITGIRFRVDKCSVLANRERIGHVHQDRSSR